MAELTCIHVVLILGITCGPCVLGATLLGYRIGAGEWPWRRRSR